MYANHKSSDFSRTLIGRVMILVVGATTVLCPVWTAFAQTSSEPTSNNEQAGAARVPTHMSEALRASIKKVAVIAGASPRGQSVTGSYEKATEGLVGGIDSGSRIGTISKEIGGVPISFPIPILTIPGAIYGGLSGAAKREIQQFRDQLTEELARAESRSLSGDGLAMDVYFGLQSLPNLETKVIAPTTPMPENTDAILYVGLDEVTIDVQGKEAIVTTSARATLRRLSDGRNLYEKVTRYQDRDTLRNWTENDNALWRDYVNFARHYLGREITAEVFDKIELRHELRPLETDTAVRDRKNERQLVSRSLSPTLAWELTLLGGDSYGPWVESIDESNIYYDVEIYDKHQLVYVEEQVQGSRHTVLIELEACKSYRWSVRPSYRVGSDIKFGEWMRFESAADAEANAAAGIYGRQASAAPAYIQDFAALRIECGKR